VVTQPVRLSYVNIMRPKTNTNDDGSEGVPTYSVQLVIPKTDTVTLNAIRAAQKAAIAEGVARGKFPGGAPKAWKNTLRDGDVEGETPELEGMMFMNVSSKTKPGVVDKRVQPILDESEIYSGMWARVDLGAFAYNTNGNKGVSFGLNHVQKIRDDERLDGATRAEDVFEEYDDGEDDSLI
jgi:hypothetical protein